jgi:hypothetical protein
MIKTIEIAFLIANLFFSLSAAASTHLTSQNGNTGRSCPFFLGDSVSSQAAPLIQAYPEAWTAFARLSSEQIFPKGLPDTLERPRYQAALDLLLEAQREMRGKLRIDFTRAPKVQFDPSRGGPDFYTYSLIRRLDFSLIYLTDKLAPEAKQFVSLLLEAKKASYDEMWSIPYYRQLEEIQISEYDMGGVWRGKKGSVKQAIVQRWWSRRDTVQWWFSSHWLQSEITNKTSLSPLNKLENAYRISWWIRAGNRGNQIIDPTRMRVSESYQKTEATAERGESIGVEVLVNKEVDQPPMGFFFTDFSDELVPALKFDGKTVENSHACIGCHATEMGSGVMAFSPYFLKTAEDWKARGYSDKVIPFLMRERAEAKYFRGH